MGKQSTTKVAFSFSSSSHSSVVQIGVQAKVHLMDAAQRCQALILFLHQVVIIQ